MWKPPQITCEFCGKTKPGTRKGQKFCDKSCRNLYYWHRAHPDSGFYSRRQSEQIIKLGIVDDSLVQGLRAKIDPREITLEGQ